MCSFEVYSKWSVQANKHTHKRAHAVTLVWSSLGLTDRLLFAGEAGSGYSSWVQVKLLLSETNVLLKKECGKRRDK